MPPVREADIVEVTNLKDYMSGLPHRLHESLSHTSVRMDRIVVLAVQFLDSFKPVPCSYPIRNREHNPAIFAEFMFAKVYVLELQVMHSDSQDCRPSHTQSSIEVTGGIWHRCVQ